MDCKSQLQVVNNEREQAACMAVVFEENLKQMKVGKLEAELKRATHELAKEERKAALEKPAKTAKVT